MEEKYEEEVKNLQKVWTDRLNEATVGFSKQKKILSD